MVDLITAIWQGCRLFGPGRTDAVFHMVASLTSNQDHNLLSRDVGHHRRPQEVIDFSDPIYTYGED